MHIDGSTEIFAIVGDPIKQVRSPGIGDVPLFVEHWEAAIAELTLRGVGLTSKDAVS